MFSVSFAQSDSTSVSAAASFAYDTLRQAQVVQDTTAVDTVTSRRVSEMPPAAKIGFIPERNFDLSVLPVLPGKREDPQEEVGKFTKLYGDFLKQERPQYGSLKAGYGMYQTIMGEGWFSVNSSRSDVLIKAGYRSSEGKETLMDYDKVAAELSARTLLSDSPASGSLKGVLGFSSDEYRLFGSVNPATQRTVVRFRGGAELRSVVGQKGEITGRAAFESVRFTDVLQVRSTTFSGSLGLVVPVGGLTGIIEAGIDKSLVNGPAGDDPYVVQAKVGLRQILREQVSIEAGAAVYNAQGSAGRSRTRIVPEASLIWFAGLGTTVSVMYRPSVGFVSFEALLETNPYLSHTTSITHTDVRHDARLGIEREFSDQAAAKLSIGYESIDAMPVFADSLRTGQWSVSYHGRTSIYDVRAELRASSSRHHVLGIDATWRRSENSSFGVMVPYLPEWEAGISYTYEFSHRARFLNRFGYRGRQRADLQGRRNLAGNFLWDAELRVDLSRAVTLSVVAENILDQRNDRWEFYRGEPRRIGAAFSVSW